MALAQNSFPQAANKPHKGERTRARIVDAAEALVLERRGADFQMAEVASACGMTKGALYYHFRDKTALVEEVFDRAASEFVLGLEQLADDSQPPHETLQALCRAFAQEVRGSGTVIVALAGELAGTPGALTRLETRIDRISTLVEAQLRRARAAGRVRPDVDLGMASTAICGAFLFAAFHKVHHHGESFDIDAFTEELLDLVRQGLATA